MNKQNIKYMKVVYQSNKQANVSSVCQCPSCGTSFVKSHYQQAFCKSKGGSVCKDNYWNNVTPSKRNNITRISPASAFFLLKKDTPVVLGYGDSQRAIDREDRENNELNFEGGGQGGNVSVERCEFCECINCRCDT